MKPLTIDSATEPRAVLDTPDTLALRAQRLAVGYRQRGRALTVLENLDLEIRPGELVCLLGPNGTGKSTLLRTLSKLQPPLAGSIEVGGASLRRMSAGDLARRLGVVLTDRVTIGALSARRVVELGRYPHLDWWGRLRDRDHRVVDWALKSTGALDLADRDINELSDGERQRVMIARALAQEPVMLILDEPTAFLDVPARVALFGLLRQLARDEQLAIVVSTHDLELALRAADAVWLIGKDAQLARGAPEDVVLSGHVAAAFESSGIRFHPEERAFRLVHGTAGVVRVRGDGLTALLAGAVAEREGFTVTLDHAPIEVWMAPDVTWSAMHRGETAKGHTYAELATALREWAGSGETPD